MSYVRCIIYIIRVHDVTFSLYARHIILLLLLHFIKYELEKCIQIYNSISKILLRKILKIDFKFKLNN